MEYIPDAPLEPPDIAENKLVIGMIETVDQLENEIPVLQEERSFINDLRGLSFVLKELVLDAYDSKINHKIDDLQAIKSRLAEIGYAA